MILIYKCGKCKKTFTLPFKASDRGELNKRNSLHVEKCPHCNFKNNIIINDVKAEISPYTNFLYGYALFVSIIIGVLMHFFFDFTFKTTSSNWKYYVFALLFFIPFIIAKAIIENDLKAVQIFNRYYV